MKLLTNLLFVTLCFHHTTAQAYSKVVQGSDCSDIWQKNNAMTSGIYRIKPKNSNLSFLVFCEMSKNGGWTFIQKHDGTNGLSFQRTWKEYKNGFGNIQGEHWLGLQYIYALTQQPNRPSKLHIFMEDFNDQTAYAEYSSFSIGNEKKFYQLRVDNYTGTAGDAFLGAAGIEGTNQNGSFFSTEDEVHDNCHPACYVEDIMYVSCSAQFHAGWWFNACGNTNLNGIWRKPPSYQHWGSCVSWPTWRPEESLKFSEMYVIFN
ncbi:fibrinogen-like protein 1 [Eleutherodactylus coqui]|uniref:fibrinogen-like protein 1 n=1 Tax=Eleutherodactylus coqui TaxID=57060 RepID=UPI0034637C2B